MNRNGVQSTLRALISVLNALKWLIQCLPILPYLDAVVVNKYYAVIIRQHTMAIVDLILKQMFEMLQRKRQQDQRRMCSHRGGNAVYTQPW